MIYYTADTHFGHANVVEMCERPYPDVDAMNEAMVAAWNERVQAMIPYTSSEICSFAVRILKVS